MLPYKPRASSFRNALADALGFAVMTAAIASIVVATSVYSEGQTRDLISDKQALESPERDENAAAVPEKPSGDPTETRVDESKTHLLGMTLELDRMGDVKVTEVGATSPAGRAGIRERDTIVSVSGLKAKDLAQWVRDVGKVLHDTPDGQAVSVEALREGRRLSLQVKVPESRAAEVRQARREQERAFLGGVQPAQELGNAQGLPQSEAAGGNPGGGGFSFGVFGDDAGMSRDGVAANRAMAQLTATGGQANAAASGRDRNAVGSNQSAGQASGQSPSDQSGAEGGQVGVAAFQTNAQGVAAYVEVHGLVEGSYLVGLNDSGGAGAPSPPTSPGQTQSQGGSQNQGQSQGQGQSRPGQGQQPGQQQQQQPGQGNPGTPPPAPPQSPGAGASLANPNSSPILAQQLDAQSNPGTTPNSNPSARDTLNAANPAASPHQNRNAPTGNPKGAPQFAIAIGRLQVGPDGSATIKHQLEGVEVQGLAGMTVTVVNTESRGGGGLKPADVNQGPRATGSAAQTARGGQAQQSRESAQPGQQHDPAANEVVATGVVQLVGAGTPHATNAQSGQTPIGGQAQQRQQQTPR